MQIPRGLVFALVLSVLSCATAVGAGKNTTTAAGDPPAETGKDKNGTGFAYGGIRLETWRPFSIDSPWNAPIAADAELDPDSAALIADWAQSSPYGPHLDVNIASFSIPLYQADALTPTYHVQADIGGAGWIGRDGRDAVALMPIPDGAMPDPQSDHHLLVVDRHRMMEWGCWAMQRQRRG
ncbi:MAG TPA: hypothetical protein VKP68_12265, partial [Ramlibacter sp.]|nr:hypothetical protein [Ramlibacter sp.]